MNIQTISKKINTDVYHEDWWDELACNLLKFKETIDHIKSDHTSLNITSLEVDLRLTVKPKELPEDSFYEDIMSGNFNVDV